MKRKISEIAMQVRCVHCKQEQYALAVAPVSRGDSPCVKCGEYSEPMTETEYRERLKVPPKEKDK